MLNKRRDIVKIILSALCDNFNHLWKLKDGTFQCRKNLFQQTSPPIELLYLWDTLCGKLKFMHAIRFMKQSETPVNFIGR